jgi:hypothetical protein
MERARTGTRISPNYEPAPQTVELIEKILLRREHRQSKQYNSVAGGCLQLSTTLLLSLSRQTKVFSFRFLR